MRTCRVVLSGVAGVAMFLAAQLLYHGPAIAAGQPQKVVICHFPPGNPANFQTITISASALASHLAHGDFPGPCANDCKLFATVCDDHNACTTDTCNPDGTCQHSVPKDCNDSNACTTDSCDPATGHCINTPRTGAACDDTNDCTSNDTCNAAGKCVGTAITGCCTTNTDCDDTNACTTDTCNPTSHTCSNTQKNCSDTNLCTVDSCDPSSGSCVHAPKSCPSGQTCDPGTGNCVGGGAPGCFACPPQDQLGFLVGQKDESSDPIFCSYPAVAGEDPHDFFCTYSKTTGTLVTDNDAGLCQPNAVNTCG